MQPPADAKESPTSWTERVRAAEAKEPPTVDESLHEPYIYIYTNIQKLYHTYRLYKYISMQLWHNFPRVSHSDIYMYVYCLGAR